MAANFNFPTEGLPYHISGRLSYRRPINHVSTLVVGDSMIRFMTDLLENTRVVSVGGGNLLDLMEHVRFQLGRTQVFLVIFHAGTNNVNKTYYPEESQMSRANQSLVRLEELVVDLQTKHRFCFVFSGCIYTRSLLVNKRINVLNSSVQKLCEKRGFTFIDNSNISPCMLKDQVHLNTTGEKAFLQNLSSLF